MPGRKGPGDPITRPWSVFPVPATSPLVAAAAGPDQLKAIFAEAEPDFSAEICAAATLDDLTPEAVERLRDMWQQDSGNPALAQLSVPRLLEDAELLVNGEITYAALVLFGTRKALGRHLAQSEVIFEYRSQIGHIAAQQRKEYREGFLLFRDELWATINLRNDLIGGSHGPASRCAGGAGLA